MQLIDKNGNVFGNGIEITGPDGKPKTSGGGGGSPTGPAGGDLYGTYPNPGVDWNLGTSTYSMYYYPLSSNPAGYLTAITSSDVTTALGYTPYNSTNPSGFITSSALTPYLTSAVAASTYYPLSNPSGFITTAALSGYLTTTAAASTYYPLTNPNAYISGITGSMVTSALGYTPYNATNPAGYIDSSALGPYLTSATAATTYQPTLVSGTNIKTINGSSVLGSGDLTISTAASWGGITGTLSSQTDLNTALNGKQATLVSGTSIKTVNGTSLLGSGDVSIGPKLLGFKGILGTSAGSTIVACHSVLIPANTLTTNSILQLIFRMYRVTGNLGQVYGRIYFNTTNNLTGASLFPTVFTMNGGSTQFMGLVERNFSYNGTTLTSYSNTAFSDYTTGTALTVTLNRTVDNYVLFTMQCQNVADIANIDLVKVFAYV